VPSWEPECSYADPLAEVMDEAVSSAEKRLAARAHKLSETEPQDGADASLLPVLGESEPPSVSESVYRCVIDESGGLRG